MEGRSTALTAATAGTAPIMKKKEKKKQEETSASSPSPIIVITRHGERADGDFPPPTGTTTGEDASSHNYCRAAIIPTTVKDDRLETW
mmetsp:Transcript_3225/g.4896  ORF Transcript_3225/g.4896 Transcript_3225/m.4896 type:complete len:88 (+) Transcript_3225:185-448(+)